MVWLNGRQVSFENQTLMALVSAYHPEAEIVIYNGFATRCNYLLKVGDEIFTYSKGAALSSDQLQSLMLSRHTPGSRALFQSAVVGVAGVGGLGSHVAFALARLGIGKLVLADFDLVEPTNLNRQAYTLAHLGMPKVEALKGQLLEANPFIHVSCHEARVNALNAKEFFGHCDVVVEAFDAPECKAELVNALLETCEMPIIAASGIAGLYSGNAIIAKRVTRRLFLVGDCVKGAGPHEGLMLPRVMIAAGHQALLVAQLLTDTIDLKGKFST